MGTRFRAILDLCKRRGFLFQSAEIYGGLRGAYDYGPLGAELKRNIANAWWSTNVHRRDDIVPVDTSIITPSRVFKTSGHVDNFTDALVDCLLTKERFRPDKAPSLIVLGASELKIPISAPDKATADAWEKQIVELLAPGAQLSRNDKNIFLHAEKILQPVIKDGLIETEGKLILKSHSQSLIVLPYNGYAEPNSNSPFLTSSRPFNLMFKTFLDSIDPIDQIIDTTLAHVSSRFSSIRQAVDTNLASSTVYLRPETAQGVFINFHHVLRTMAPLHPPFGIAQQGKSFRNEIRLEHAIFRTPEFEQLELEYFVPPWESQYWFEHWKYARVNWWLEFANNRSCFRTRDHSISELAHYARGCVDIEYDFPWGWGEVEGVAHRGDFDLSQHADATEERMEYLDREPAISPQIPESDRISLNAPSGPISYIPHVIESSAGLNRAMLAYLCDAYTEITSSKESRIILRLHPRLAPVKVAVLPLIPKPELMPFSQKMATLLRHHGIYTMIEAQNLKIGKRYYRHDEIGTPWCITIDFDSLNDGQVTLRHRDDGHQDRLRPEAVVDMIRDWLHV